MWSLIQRAAENGWLVGFTLFTDGGFMQGLEVILNGVGRVKELRMLNLTRGSW